METGSAKTLQTLQVVLDLSTKAYEAKIKKFQDQIKHDMDIVQQAIDDAFTGVDISPLKDDLEDIRKESRKTSETMDKSMAQMQQTVKYNTDRMESSFNKAKSALKSVLSIAAIIAAAKQLSDFTGECIELGSDLNEVQNVVHVTFTSMEKDVNSFAQSAIDKFGLSETMAKRYTGTFGAMAKSFGFTEDAAYDMSTTLAGLSGDVASFYNLTQNESYTKLKSIFTGETESLKDLGIVMTQNALDSYAMANGFDKTTASMTEQEKVALQYRFVLDQLSLAQGDFARTSTSWANQARVLNLRIESIKASLGQSFINLFTPILIQVNQLLARIDLAAKAVKSFTELITGNSASEGSGITDSTGALADISSMAGNAGSGLLDAADSAGNLADKTNAVGDAAKQAAKEMRTLLGFDQINKLSEPASSSNGGSGSGSGAGGSGGSGSSILGGTVDFGKVAEGENVIDDFSNSLKELLEWISPTTDAMKTLYNDGFQKLEGFTWGTIQDFWENFLKPMGTWYIRDDAGLPRFFYITNGLLNDIDWERLRGSLGKFYTSLQGPAKFSWTGLMDFYESFLVPVQDWTMSEAIPALVDEVTDFNTNVDWDKLNAALGKFWGALSKLTTGIGQGAIDFITDFKIGEKSAGLVNGFADALDWFGDVIEEIPEDALNATGEGLAALATGFIAYKGMSGIGNTLKTVGSGLGSLLGVVKAHPALSLTAAGIATTAFLGSLYEKATQTGFAESVNGIAGSVDNLSSSLEGIKGGTEADYNYINTVLDKFLELNSKKLNGSLTEGEASLFKTYYDELVEYAPAIESQIGGIEDAYIGTRDALQELIDKQREQYMVAGYQDVMVQAYKDSAEAAVLLKQETEEAQAFVDGLGGNLGILAQAALNTGQTMNEISFAPWDWDDVTILNNYITEINRIKESMSDADEVIGICEQSIKDLGASIGNTDTSMLDFSETAGNAATSFIRTFSDRKQDLINAVKGFTDTTKNTVDAELEISGEESGYSGRVGGTFVKSLLNPLAGKKIDVETAVRNFAGILPAEVDNVLGISGETSSVMQKKGELATQSIMDGSNNKLSVLTDAFAALPGSMIASMGLLDLIFSVQGALIPAGIAAGFNIGWLLAKPTFTGIPNKIHNAIGDLSWIGREAGESLARGFRSVHIPSPHFSIGTMGASAAGVNFSLPRVNVAWYASGGLPETGQMFIARESGPEMVGSIGRKSAVANNSQIVESISAGVKEAVIEAMLMTSGNETAPIVEINVITDDVTLYRRTLRGKKIDERRYSATAKI